MAEMAALNREVGGLGKQVFVGGVWQLLARVALLDNEIDGVGL